MPERKITGRTRRSRTLSHPEAAHHTFQLRVRSQLPPAARTPAPRSSRQRAPEPRDTVGPAEWPRSMPRAGQLASELEGHRHPSNPPSDPPSDPDMKDFSTGTTARAAIRKGTWEGNPLSALTRSRLRVSRKKEDEVRALLPKGSLVFASFHNAPGRNSGCHGETGEKASW